MEKESIKLQKFISMSGICSRRKAEEYILKGDITVNGKTAKIGDRVTGEENICLKGKTIHIEEKKAYIILNKPLGVVTTTSEQFGRKKVTDLISNKSLKPAGRLDMYTTGAIILTNDGEFIQKITHPKFEVRKTYLVTVKNILNKEQIEKLKNGIIIDNKKTSKAEVKVMYIKGIEKESKFAITIHEGRNRQVRKMCKEVGLSVISLHRSMIGNLDIRDLKVGEYKYLKKEDLNKIFS